MGISFTLIWIAFIIIFYFFTKASNFRKYTKAQSFNPQGLNNTAKENLTAPRHSTQRENYKTKPAGIKIHKAPKEKDPLLFEDREHDWLAMQLKEEAVILRKANSLDLGAVHSASCDAKAIKLMHMLEHDDSIDHGEL